MQDCSGISNKIDSEMKKFNGTSFGVQHKIRSLSNLLNSYSLFTNTDYKRNIKRIKGFTAATMETCEITQMIKPQHEKTKIENDTVKLVNNVEALLEGAAKARIPSLKFQGEVWTSPFGTVMRTFEAHQKHYSKVMIFYRQLATSNVIWTTWEEASVKETWNARMNNKNGGCGVIHGKFSWRHTHRQ